MTLIEASENIGNYVIYHSKRGRSLRRIPVKIVGIIGKNVMLKPPGHKQCNVIAKPSDLKIWMKMLAIMSRKISTGKTEIN